MSSKVIMPSITNMPPAIAKQEGAAIATAAVGTLVGRSVTSWAQTCMIIGVVAAVVGVATALFTSSIFAAVGFGLLGVVSAIGVFATQNAFDSEQLQNSIARLSQEHAFLDEQTKKMEAAALLAEQQSKYFKEAEARLNVKVRELEAENLRIQRANKDLEKALADMKAANQQLAENKEALGRRIAGLEQAVQSAKQVLKDFLTTNVEFAARIGVFSTSVAGLVRAEEQMRKTIETLNTAAHTEIPNLEKFIELGNALGEYLVSHVRSQTESHHKLLEEYRAEIARLESASITLRTHIADNEEMAKRFADREVSLIAAGQAIAKENERLAALSATIENQKAEMAAEREGLAAEVTALTATKTDLLDQLVKLREAIETKIAKLEALKEERRALRGAAAI